MSSYKILFFGKKNDKYSLIFIKKLKKNFKNVKIIFFNGNKSKVLSKIKIDIIISFRSLYIINKKLLSNSKFSFNFHPGPPEYRGIGCVNFAILNNEKFYGSTLHLTNNKIDNGKIIDVKRFKIKKSDNIDKILDKTYNQQLKQLDFLILAIKNSTLMSKILDRKNKAKWSKKLYTKKDLENLYSIDKDITKNKLMKILKSTITKKFKPYISIHKKKFYFDEI
jgi:methionyl-tRNA formyltransferase